MFPSRRLWRWLFGLCLLGKSIFVSADTTLPPTQVMTVDLAASGPSNVKESGRIVDHQSDQMGSFSFLQRHPIQGGPFYISGGLHGESFHVDNAHQFPIHELQDYGAQLSIEYYVGAVKAAYLTLQPGFYFENHPTLAAWDVPVEFATGIPITSTLNGAAGISWGRFWHHPVPIAGLSWMINPRLRLDALYPDPTLAYTINDQWTTRLTGELLGNGFLSDPEPNRSVIQYWVYRVGGNVDWQLRPGFKITSGAGFEYQRVFDYWRAGQLFWATGAPFVRLGIELSR